MATTATLAFAGLAFAVLVAVVAAAVTVTAFLIRALTRRGAGRPGRKPRATGRDTGAGALGHGPPLPDPVRRDSDR